MGRPLLDGCARVRRLPTLAVWELSHGPLVTALVLGVTFWVLLGLVGDEDSRRPTTSGRYQYLGAVFVILAAAELYRGTRPSRATLAAVLAVAVLATVGNLRSFDSSRDFLHNLSIQTHVNLGAAEIAGSAADPRAEPTLGVELGPYLDAVAAYGSPAYSEAEIMRSSEFERELVDQELGKLYALAPVSTSASGPPPLAAHCVRLAPGTPATASIGPGAVRIEATGDAALALRRFADQYPLLLGSVKPNQPAVVTVPGDESSVRWTLAVTSQRPSRVCAL